MTPKPSAALRYTTMRLGIFILCFVVLAGLVRLRVLPSGLGDSNYLWVLLLALVVSMPLSLVLLRRQRDEMSAQIVGRMDRAKERLDANRGMEDEAVDEAEDETADAAERRNESQQ
ncbi:DUF4229 domain-containing protein [Streptomyces boninensis]|uniref:DUF4229 domain-containing protein n=1 Tax=Streptomyces boninensis TaxID=2039455 RepID=UPI003B214512